MGSIVGLKSSIYLYKLFRILVQGIACATFEEITTKETGMKARQRRARARETTAAARRGGRKVIVEFSASLYAETERATVQLSINRSALIRSAVQEFLDKWHREELEKQMAEGYLANARQARETAQAFSHVDSELP